LPAEDLHLPTPLTALPTIINTTLPKKMAKKEKSYNPAQEQRNFPYTLIFSINKKTKRIKSGHWTNKSETVKMPNFNTSPIAIPQP
jgi:hypothetical protein